MGVDLTSSHIKITVVIDRYATERAVAIDLYRRSGMSQQEFARFCGLSQAGLSGVLNGTKGSRNTFAKIAAAHGMGYGDYFPENEEATDGPESVLVNLIKDVITKEAEIEARIKQLEHRVENHITRHPKPGAV